MRGLIVLVAALALPIQLVAAAEQRRPTMQDMQAWKRDVLARYGQVTFLDEHRQPITEEAFMRRAVEEHRAFRMESSAGSTAQLLVRFLADEEARN